MDDGKKETMNTVFRLHKAEKNNYHSSRGHNKIIHGAVQVLVASVLLVIALCCSAYAVNIDATVPASLPITVSADGTVTTATNAAIRNYGSSPIIVSSINVTAQNGWSLATKDDAAAAAVGDKVISMGINGSWMDASGVVDTSGFSRIAASNPLCISYEAKIPGTMTSESESTAATATFVVGLPPEPPTMAAGSSWYKSSVDRNTITKITFMDRYTPSTEADETWFADENNNGDITCYRTGTEIIIAGNGAGKIQANANSSYMFSYTSRSYCFKKLTSIENLSLLDTSKVTDMASMFNYCYGLKSIDLSGFDTSKVTDMSHMFYGCSGLPSIDLSDFDTSKVTNMSHMFYGCSGLPSIDLSDFDTSNVTTMASMFNYCYGLKSIDLSGFDTSKVTDMNTMFYGCIGLTSIDLSGFDTSKVTDMNTMFYACRSLPNIDLSDFDTSNVTNMSNMFGSCIGLATIYASDKWNTDKVSSNTGMFSSCTKLKGDIAFDSSYIDKTYAKTSGGYLTYKAAATRTLLLNIDPSTGTVTSYDVFPSPLEQLRTALSRVK